MLQLPLPAVVEMLRVAHPAAVVSAVLETAANGSTCTWIAVSNWLSALGNPMATLFLLWLNAV